MEQLSMMKHMNNLSNTLSANRPVILVVEDHADLRTTLVDWLSNFFSSCEFISAGSGEEAIEVASTHHSDIVLMDIRLPHMNGIEAVRHIKEISPETQVIMLSIMSGVTYISEAKAVGACAYLNKQQMHTDLIPILNKLLSAKAPAAGLH